MISASPYRALVVDDEAVVRLSTMRALSRSGFTCDPAANGLEAIKMARQSCYDLVVTDLRMPDGNGHQLAVDLLDLPNRPAIMIMTGVMETKLYNDLRLRGVDDVAFKPVDLSSLAQRGLAIVQKRKLAEAGDSAGDPAASTEVVSPVAACPLSQLVEIKSRVAGAMQLLPIPPADFDGLAMATSKAVTSREIAMAVETDPSFAVEFVQLSNRAIYESHRSLTRPRGVATRRSELPLMKCGMLVGAGILAGIALGWLVGI